MNSLNGKVVLATGANGGIGLAAVSHLLTLNTSVFVVDNSPPSAEIEGLIAKYTGAIAYAEADITARNAGEQLVNQCVNEFGRIDVLFNNAAVFDMAPLLDSDEAMYERIFNVNVKGMFFVMQAVAAQMVKQGSGGAIVNMASQAGRRGEALVSHYCASKAAVISYTQSAALALSEQQIRVNAISPGVIDTPMWSTVDALFAKYEGLELGEKKRMVGEAVPLGRMGDPEDIAGVVAFLASDESRYITGQTLNVDGGNVLS